VPISHVSPCVGPSACVCVSVCLSVCPSACVSVCLSGRSRGAARVPSGFGELGCERTRLSVGFPVRLLVRCSNHAAEAGAEALRHAITETYRMQLVLFGMQDRTFGPNFGSHE
jgi:hypothetical protein